ncbi:MAG TPA: hypothetical protein VL860_00215 [Planctomycetota bacterium]|nr:hypothetical protein [Planctomycetota bacterium]
MKNMALEQHRLVRSWTHLPVLMLLASCLVQVGASAEEKPATPAGELKPVASDPKAPAGDVKPAAPKEEDKGVTDLRKTGLDLIAKLIKVNPGNLTVDLLVEGQTKLVDLVEVDKARTLRYKQFGKKSEIPFGQITTIQVAGLLGALTTEEFPEAAKAHLTAGLLYAVEGKTLESSSEIAKAVALDPALDSVASEQLKALPKPPPPPNASPDMSGFAGSGVSSGSGSAMTPGEKTYAAVPAGPWMCMGFGGGGSIYTPVISPHDPKVGMVTCDMSGIYLTRDGGRHWQILPRMSNGRGLAFSPTDPNVIFVGTISMTYRSGDMGLTWKTVTKDYQYPQCSVWDICVDPDDGNSVWATFGRGTIEAGMPQMATKMQIERSTDAGNNFADASAGLSKGNGMVRKLAVDRSTPVGSRTLYAATSDGFYRSTNQGAAWEEFGKGLPTRNLRDISALYDKASKKTTLLVVMETGGMYRSEDGGATFKPSGAGISDKADGSGVVLNAVGASWVDAQTVWSVGKDTWKSVDGGRTWKAFWTDATKFAGVQLVTHPWSHDGGYGIGCSPKNPNIMWFTGCGDLFTTNDGGATLTEMSSHPMPEGTPRFSYATDACWHVCKTAPITYDGGNLEVTNCYQVIPDPNNPKIWYTGFADVGSWRTEDGGTSWIYNMGWWNSGIKSEWRNSVYEIAPDPRKPGRLYQVCSNRHDLPGKDVTDTEATLGGVAISDDYGKVWTPLEKTNLPEKCMTSILLDSRSGGQATLWVTVYATGVFRSTNEGGSWDNVSKGLPSTIRAWRLRQASDGSVYLICANEKPGGVWRFDDKTSEWSLLPASKEFGSVCDMIVGPKGFMAVAVEQSSRPAKGQESDGGIFASYDFGKSWKKMYAGNFKAVERSPDGQWWFAGGHGGLWRSLDGGATWTEDKELPFYHVNDLTLNPKNPGELWVGTAGCGVFKGSSTGSTSTPPAPISNPPAAQ